ncbi:MAG TPA: hypothetical protein VFD60_05110 [Nitrososphaeraceae archaeon]|jgi:hypothetical protein|nr:hypothetical protein [Nitrososphaeraceae archaeon]
MDGYNAGLNSCGGRGGGGNGGQSRPDIVQRFCTSLNNGNLAGAEATAHSLGYSYLDIAARLFCGIVSLANR